jgi:hypothetical protein
MRTIARTLALVLVSQLVLGVTPGVTKPKPKPVGPPPTTGFEQRGGADWTTNEEEWAFLEAVDSQSPRASMRVIGQTLEARPLHLVRLGVPVARRRARVLQEPTVLFICSQHGNEPAGREACLRMLRDLAFTTDPTLVRQLKRQSVLFIPNANPDGHEANTRGNAEGTDINRDHLNLLTPEAQAIGRVIRRWKPDAVIDLHEYSQTPALYDEEMQILWPRNLNVESRVYTMSKTLAVEYIGKGVSEAGYTWDEYGIYDAGDQNVTQTAGDSDPGILRNLAGLRHSLGILLETDSAPNVKDGGPNDADPVESMNRRVDSHYQAVIETLRFFRDQGRLAARVTDKAPLRKRQEGLRRSAPVYFGGADNDPPEASEIQDPPPCAYSLTAEQAGQLTTQFTLLGIKRKGARRGVFRIPMGQPAEPLIPLLLDERGTRHAVEGTPLMACRRRR